MKNRRFIIEDCLETGQAQSCTDGSHQGHEYPTANWANWIPKEIIVQYPSNLKHLNKKFIYGYYSRLIYIPIMHG